MIPLFPAYQHSSKSSVDIDNIGQREGERERDEDNRTREKEDKVPGILLVIEVKQKIYNV